MKREDIESRKVSVVEEKPSVKYRSLDRDNPRRVMYMVTMPTEGHRPLFGEVEGRSDAPADSPEAPRLVLTPLGQRVCDEWWGIPREYPEVEIIALQMMPDHFHGIILVRKQMQHNLSRIILDFKKNLNRAFRKLSLSSAVARQEPKEQSFDLGHFSKHLLRQHQLEHWLLYLSDNPRRLLLRREQPELFHQQRQTEVCGLQFTSMGNHFLLDRPSRQHVEISRRATSQQISDRLAKVLSAARNGAVTYTAARSDGDKLIARTVRHQGFPLVVLLTEGFPQQGTSKKHHYTPGGVYFEACSQGHLLLLAPHDSTTTLTTLLHLLSPR